MNTEANTAKTIERLLTAVRTQHPLVHNITNYVVMNTTANTLLALDAMPVMAHAIEEVEELAVMAGALVINIGTLSTPWIEAMFAAARVATRHNVPIVFDPVGAGVTRLRTETSLRFVNEIKPQVIRGNASEILALGGLGGGGKGVDAAHTVPQARATAIELSRRYKLTVAVTGAEDYVTDGQREARVANGHPLMARVTGTGCAASALTGAFCAVERDAFMAATAALVVFNLAGERAAEGDPHPGTFQVRLLDALDEMNDTRILRQARVIISELQN